MHPNTYITPEREAVISYAILQAAADILENDPLLPSIRFSRKETVKAVEPIIKLINPIMATKQFSDDEMKLYKQFARTARDMAAILERKELEAKRAQLDAKTYLRRLATNIEFDVSCDEGREGRQKSDIADQLIDMANHVKVFMAVSMAVGDKPDKVKEKFEKKFETLISSLL